MYLSSLKCLRTLRQKEAALPQETTWEGRAFQIGIVVQKKEDRWREVDDGGNSREWEERSETVERELAAAGRRASSCGGPWPFRTFHRTSKQCSRRRQASVGKQASCGQDCRRVAGENTWNSTCQLQLYSFQALQATLAGSAPHCTAVLELRADVAYIKLLDHNSRKVMPVSKWLAQRYTGWHLFD